MARDKGLFIQSERGGGWLIDSVRQLKAEMRRLSEHFRDQDRYRQAAAKFLAGYWQGKAEISRNLGKGTLEQPLCFQALNSLSFFILPALRTAEEWSG